MGGERQRILIFMVQLLDRCTRRLWKNPPNPHHSNSLLHFPQYLHTAGVCGSWRSMPKKTHCSEFQAIISHIRDCCAHWNNTFQYIICSFNCVCSHIWLPQSVGNYERILVFKQPSHSYWHKTIQGWRDHLNNQVHNPSSYSDYWTVSGSQDMLLQLPLLFRNTDLVECHGVHTDTCGPSYSSYSHPLLHSPSYNYFNYWNSCSGIPMPSDRNGVPCSYYQEPLFTENVWTCMCRTIGSCSLSCSIGITGCVLFWSIANWI